jgi:hypothetical protein
MTCSRSEVGARCQPVGAEKSEKYCTVVFFFSPLVFSNCGNRPIWWWVLGLL